MSSAQNPLTRVIRSVRYNFRRGGVGQLFKKVWRLLCTKMWSEQSWVLLEAPLEGYSLSPRVTISHRIVNENDLSEARYFKLIEFPEVIRDRFCSGIECHAFYLDDTFVNLHWLSFGNLPVIPPLRIVEQDSLGVFDGMTVPEFRRRGINLASHIIIANYAKTLSVKRLISIVDPNNIASIHSLQKAGYSPREMVVLRYRGGFAKLLKRPL